MTRAKLIKAEELAKQEVFELVRNLANESYHSKWEQLRDLDNLNEARLKWENFARKFAELKPNQNEV